MIVCIAEKPSVATDIANVLGATVRHEGYMEGNGYQVTWTFGHLCELKEPHEYDPAWKSWRLSLLPMIPSRFGIKLKADKGIEKQFRTIKTLMGKADSIVNCGDAGQEGELIQRWVMQKAQVKCPVKRLWINSLTKEAISEGFHNLKDQSEYQSLYEAGLMRAIGDWMLGMNATRLYTLKYAYGQGQVLSVGRVQTPTLALIVNRQREIENFVPRQSWTLTTLYRDVKFAAIQPDEDAEAEEAAEDAKQGKTAKQKGTVYKQMEFGEERQGKLLMDSIAGKPFVVLSVTKKKGSEAPPRLYDLTSLQVDCNRKFGYSADTTLRLAQSLYEKKVTTYPRVDTTYLPDDVYPKCGNVMNGLFLTKTAGESPYAALVKPLGGKPLKKSKKVFDNSKVTDHHAIIPTGVPPGALNEMEQNVFDLVARSFIAAFYPDCQFQTTSVMGKVTPETGEDVLFRANGRSVVDEGWKAVMHKNAQNGDDEPDTSSAAVQLPAFGKGESGAHTPSLNEKWTTPPKPFTEATLLRAMETAGKLVDNEDLRDALKENGIGRPSTRAAIIETLFKRHYIRKERKNLIATPTGTELIDIIREDLLKSAELTGLWEKKLRQIEHHEYDARTFLDELKQMVCQVVTAVLKDSTARRVSANTAPSKASGKGKSKK